MQFGEMPHTQKNIFLYLINEYIKLKIAIIEAVYIYIKKKKIIINPPNFT